MAEETTITIQTDKGTLQVVVPKPETPEDLYKEMETSKNGKK